MSSESVWKRGRKRHKERKKTLMCHFNNNKENGERQGEVSEEEKNWKKKETE